MATAFVKTELNVERLALDLLHCETEEEVVDILSKLGFWDDPNQWKFFGDNENNFSIIGNQQSTPDASLVEKLVNSVDAVLLREAWIRGIAPDGPNAPENLHQALEQFFSIPQGKLSNLEVRERNDIARNIWLVATGSKSKPSYMIIDNGEGQSPDRLPDTILSLSKSNKLRVPFVQGKFNMGGTGVLTFCGKRNLQLVISKRHPNIGESDEAREYWGVTIVRREDPTGGRRSSAYTYLAPGGNILRFQAETLNLLPKDNVPYAEALTSGTLFKLYEYKLPGLTTNILFDLYNRISLLMPGTALPVRFAECRDYQGHTLQTTMSGLNVRLDEDKRENLEAGFPLSTIIKVEGQTMPVSIFAFKENQAKKYRKDEGVIFTINGQTHGFLSKSFFIRKAVGMAYIADSLLVTVDCSGIDGRSREDLFMNSRDRLRDGELRQKIEATLEEEIKDNQALKALREERRRKALQNKLDEAKPLAEVLEKMLKRSPTLSKLFISGERLSNPFNLKDAGQKEVYVGKKFPTFFRLNSGGTEDFEKHCPLNSRFRVQFETDATNDYFMRDNDPGTFTLECNGHEVREFSINLHNGHAYLTVTLPDSCVVGDTLNYLANVSDYGRAEPFVEKFRVVVESAVERGTKGNPGKKKKPTDGPGSGNSTPAGLALPEVTEVTRDEWSQYEFTKDTALHVIDSGEGGYDFLINIDNVHLNTELKGLRDDQAATVLKARYKYGMVLVGLSILNSLESGRNQDDSEEADVAKVVANVTKMLSPVLLPMIDSLGDITDSMEA